jgi:hypothetical protein
MNIKNGSVCELSHLYLITKTETKGSTNLVAFSDFAIGNRTRYKIKEFFYFKTII